jgi:transcriptional regulator with XRE-family HTH domain
MDTPRTLFTKRRLELRLSQADLAARARTSRKTISDFELGLSGLQLATLERLLAAMGLEISFRTAASRPQLDELAHLYPDDLGDPPRGNQRIRRSKKAP